MKKLLTILAVVFISLNGNAQTKDSKKIVEASCGQCNFGMEGKKGCDLAVRINGIPYFVDGANIKDYGDAHAEDGFCNAIRKAKVSGKVENNRFVATSFKLLPAKKRK